MLYLSLLFFVYIAPTRQSLVICLHEFIMSISFAPNSLFQVTGSTGSGKSYWVFKFLKNLPSMFADTPTKKVMYCYGIYQPLFDEMKRVIPGIMFHEGLPHKEEMQELSRHGHALLILDDLMQEVSNSKDMLDLFCQYSHHMGISVMYLSQNLFQQGRFSRTIALNTHVLVVLKSMRNASQISCFARQLYPNRRGMLEEIYEDCMQAPFAYLVVDMSPNACSQYRLRTHIFPEEYPPVIYMPKKV